jgi:hypothetical protein
MHIPVRLLIFKLAACLLRIGLAGTHYPVIRSDELDAEYRMTGSEKSYAELKATSLLTQTFWPFNGIV